MKKTLATLAAMLAAAPLLAGGDPVAMSMLDKARADLVSHDSRQIAFVERVSDSAGKQLSLRHGLLRIKGDRYRLTLGELDQLCDGQRVATLDAAGHVVSAVPAAAAPPGPQTPFLDVMRGRLRDGDWLFGPVTKTKSGPYTVSTTVAMAANPSWPYFRLTIALASPGQPFRSIAVQSKNGNRSNFEVNGIDPTVALDDALFVIPAAGRPPLLRQRPLAAPTPGTIPTFRP